MTASLPHKKCTFVRNFEKDSWWSWLVLLCAFLSHIIMTGSIASFGVFYPLLLREFKQDKAITVLVNSLCFLVAGFLAPVNGKLIDRFGNRTMLLSCFMTCAVSYLICSFVTNFYILFATYGVLFGYVLCSIANTVFLGVATLFEKRRTFAIGIIAAGFGAGVLTMTPIIQVLLSHFGFRGAFRALAGITLVSSPLAGIFNTDGSDENNAANSDIIKEKNSSKTLTAGWKQVLKCFSVNGDLSALVLSCSVTVGMGMWIPIVYMAKYGQGLGISPIKTSQLYMAFGLSDIAGRVSTGYIVNLHCLTPKRLYTIAALTGTIVTALLPLATKHVHLLVVNALFGWLEGVVTSSSAALQLQAIVETVPTNLQGRVFGVCNGVYYIFCAVGPPIAGLLVEVFGSYASTFYVASAIELFGIALICLTYCFPKSKKQLTQQHFLSPESYCQVLVEKVSVV